MKQSRVYKVIVDENKIDIIDEVLEELMRHRPHSGLSPPRYMPCPAYNRENQIFKFDFPTLVISYKS